MRPVHVHPCQTEANRLAETKQVDIGASHFDLFTWRVKVSHTAVADIIHHHHLKATTPLHHSAQDDLPAGFTAELAVPSRPPAAT